MAAQDPNAPTDSNGVGLLVAGIVTLAVSWLSMGLRTYVRAVMNRSFQVDDWVMLAGLVNFTVSCSFVFIGITFGLGRHNKSLSQSDEIEALKWQALATASYVSNMWLIKLSIGIFLLRLAGQKRYKYILGTSIVVVGVWSLALFFWNIFQCNPVAAQWDYTILERDSKAHCVSADEVVSAAYALSALTIFSDWLYALIPIPMIWQVRMTVQAKWSVIAVLGLGVFASIATLIRLKFLSDLTDVSDILHAGTDAMTWTLVEPGIAISAASLATIRPLLRRMRITGFTSSERSRTTGHRSQDQGSRIRRASKMPGFGSQDVTLVDIEHGSSGNSGPNSKTAGHKMTHLPKVFEVSLDAEESGLTRGGDTINSDFHSRGRAEVTSEVFIIEGVPTPPHSREGYQDTGVWFNQESDDSSIELRRPPRAAKSHFRR
ncbi:hypothetical protein F5Y17DRAFT_465320 [Xylariaceae sp. FL0594]|nr:hypothetical protein F5Y17DRAFT_465320 [Xylariaceae sp. FL0594]